MGPEQSEQNKRLIILTVITLSSCHSNPALACDQIRPDQARSDQIRPDQTRPNQFRPVQTSSDQFRPVQTSSDQFRPVQTTKQNKTKIICCCVMSNREAETRHPHLKKKKKPLKH
jgi:hypothetical protein